MKLALAAFVATILTGLLFSLNKVSSTPTTPNSKTLLVLGLGSFAIAASTGVALGLPQEDR